MSDNAGSDEAKKRKLVTPFTESGICIDEVTLSFDEGKELYVSRGLLCCASPVFHAMFTSEFKEKNSGVVEMIEKRYEDVLEFLLTLHPAVQKKITVNNVYTVLSLAEEYQAYASISKCKKRLEQKLNSEYETVKTGSDEYKRTTSAVACFKILETVLLYNYEEIKNNAITTISRFGSSVYLNDELDVTGNLYAYDIKTFTCHYKSAFAGSDWHDKKDEVLTKRKECRDMFNSLPDCIKQDVMRKRMNQTDDNRCR